MPNFFVEVGTCQRQVRRQKIPGGATEKTRSKNSTIKLSSISITYENPGVARPLVLAANAHGQKSRTL